MSTIEHKLARDPESEVKATVDTDARTISGYGNVSAVLDRAGDIVLPGSATESLKGLTPKLMWQHRDALGVMQSISEDGYGIRVEKGYVSRTTLGDDALTLMADGAVDSMSIGYRVTDRAYVESTDEKTILDMVAGLGLDAAQVKRLKSSIKGGQLAKWAPYGVRLIKTMDVVEVSAVTVPANPWATLDRGKSWSDLRLPIADGMVDGEPVDPKSALLDDDDVCPSLVRAAYLLPDSKGIPLIEMVGGVPMHTPRAIRAALGAVKGGALRDHGDSTEDAEAFLDALAKRAGVAISSPTAARVVVDLGPLLDVAKGFGLQDSITSGVEALRTLARER